MKFCCLILLILVGGCYAENQIDANFDPDAAVTETIKTMFQNLTTFFHHSDPNVNGAFDEITHCIIEESLDEAMENLVIKSYKSFQSRASVEVRSEICKENKEVINSFIYCLVSAQTSKFRDFLTALALTSEFLIDEFCLSLDVTEFPGFFDEQYIEQLRTKIPQELAKPFDRLDELKQQEGRFAKRTPEDSCLPIRYAESMEIIAIYSRKFPFFVHGAIANLVHLLITINFDFPFKSYHECA